MRTLLAVVSLVVATATGDPQPEPPVRVETPPRTFTVAAVGDWLSEDLVNRQAAAAAPPGTRYDHEPLLRPVAPIIGAADLAICHMETPIGAPGAKVGLVGRSPLGRSLIAAPYELAFDLKRVGFDRCSTASNHSYDLGTNGIRTTLEAFDAAALTHTGTARTVQESAVDVFPVNGVQVAHMSYARNTNTAWPPQDWQLDKAVTAGPVIADVDAARDAGAEVVIVSIHVFVEMQSAPTPDDRTLVQQITAQSDVDLVIIHGPHVIQPFELVNGTWVYWSLGNFMSGMGVPNRGKYSDPRALDGLMGTARFTEQPDGSWLVEPWAVLVCNVTGSRIAYPGVTWMSDPATSPPAGSLLRSQLAACINRTVAVEADVH